MMLFISDQSIVSILLIVWLVGILVDLGWAFEMMYLRTLKEAKK